MQTPTKQVITILAINNPSVLRSVLKSFKCLLFIVCIRVKIIVIDSKKTKIYVNVTVGLTAVFFLTIGRRAIKETIKVDKLNNIFPFYLLF